MLDRMVGEVDLVMSMIPPAMHIPVAQACLAHQKHMVTTSYISPAMEALDDACRKRDILILNEIGEDPGLDNMGVKREIDHVKARGGEISGVISYGAGLPAFEHNNNPLGYKISWSPKGLISAAQASATYLRKGQKVHVPARDLFDHHWFVDLEGIGTFETYPNRDCTKYLRPFGLKNDVSLFRGLLRYAGWCNLMKGLADLQLLDTTDEKVFAPKSYARLMAMLIGEENSDDILAKTADFLGIRRNSDLIKKLDWLGLFGEQPIAISQGSNADVLVELMSRKMSYGPFEQDMVILHNEISAKFPNRQEKRVASLLVKGEPGGDTAMSRAVSLPAAIAARRILEGKIRARGVQRPTLKTIYQPVLDEMCEFGYRFKQKTISIDTSVNRCNA
jgi:saccharopine dehydrogenase-like NADP-dependent oxidoreductase